MASVVVDALTVVLGTGWLFGLGLFFLIAGQLTGPSLDRGSRALRTKAPRSARAPRCRLHARDQPLPRVRRLPTEWGHFGQRFNRLRPVAWLMAPFAYGTFILHPPVIVGLALAIQPLPVSAELKFGAVLAAGVAGSFSLAAVVSRMGPVARVIGSPASAHPAPRPVPVE
jgi:hypothetical protein